MSGAGPEPLKRRLEQIVFRHIGPGRAVEQLDLMVDGHAGLTFGFDVVELSTGRKDQFILKLAPAGVRRSGNTDVYRQAPLLEALYRARLPVPRLCFAAPDEAELGVPYIVMERLPGRTFVVWEPHPSFDQSRDSVAALWTQAATALAQVHRFNWRQQLSGWEQPRTLADELGRWDRILSQAPEAAWIEAGRLLAARLAEHLPATISLGLVHGDFQPGNILFDAGRLVAIIDWELSLIGSQGLDLGWLMMMADEACWHRDWRPVAPIRTEELALLYSDAGGPAIADTDWHRALASYRLGVIACLNIKLHRTGKRPDALWERFALSIPMLFRRGIDLLPKHRVAGAAVTCGGEL